MTNNFWYNYIQCDRYAAIQHDLRCLILPNIDSYKNRYSHINTEQVLASSHELQSWLNELGVGTIRRIGLITSPPDSIGSTHTDNQTNDLALNIGVQTSNSYTNMFKIVTGEPTIIKLENQVAYISYDSCTLEVQHRYDISLSPALINTKKVHQVMNPNSDWRICVSIRFDVDPLHLAV